MRHIEVISAADCLTTHRTGSLAPLTSGPTLPVPSPSLCDGLPAPILLLVVSPSDSIFVALSCSVWEGVVFTQRSSIDELAFDLNY